MNKKDTTIVALATFCLTSALFMMLPIRSETPVGTYDPWIDVNEDGSINLLDAIMQGNHFLTSGDSTKNVTIVQHASKLAFTVFNQTVGSWQLYDTPHIDVDGYSRFAVNIWHNSTTNSFSVWCRHEGGVSFMAEFIVNLTTSFVKTYDVPNQQISLSFYNTGTTSCFLYMDVYLIA